MKFTSDFTNVVASVSSGTYGYNPNARRWHRTGLGERLIVNVYVDSNTIRVDESPYHPLMKRALETLVKQYPDLKDHKLDFDGWLQGNIRDFLTDSSLHQDKSLLPRFLYTGTSYHRWESIREDGLRPRSETGMSPAYGAMMGHALPANPEHIYLSATFNAATRFAANDAARGESEGSYPVVLKVDTRGLNPRLVRPDVDAKESNWQQSLYEINTVAYEGVIDSQYITLYMAWNPESKKWEDPGFIRHDDWLAQQVVDTSGYTSIPGTTGKYKWVHRQEQERSGLR